MQNKNRNFNLVCAWVILFSAFVAAQKQNADSIVSGGTVATMSRSRRITAAGAVAVAGASIAAVGPRSEVEAAYVGRQTIEAKGKLVLPGWINGHSHVPMTLLRGLH